MQFVAIGLDSFAVGQLIGVRIEPFRACSYPFAGKSAHEIDYGFGSLGHESLLLVAVFLQLQRVHLFDLRFTQHLFGLLPFIRAKVVCAWGWRPFHTRLLPPKVQKLLLFLSAISV